MLGSNVTNLEPLANVTITFRVSWVITTPFCRLPFAIGMDSRNKRVNSSSLSILKTRINSNINLPPSYYFIGKRIYHARLRTKCSSLRQHLFSKKSYRPAKMCMRFCGIQSPFPVIILCDQYTDLRRELLTTVSEKCNPTLDKLLYGDPSLSLEENKAFVLAVHDFILKSKRFQQSNIYQ